MLVHKHSANILLKDKLKESHLPSCFPLPGITEMNDPEGNNILIGSKF